MEKKRVLVVIVAMISAFSVMPMIVSGQGNPGAGCPSETKFHSTLHGGVYFEQKGYASFKEMTQTFDVPSGTINLHVYIQVSGKAVRAKADILISPFRTPPAGLIPLPHTRHATPVLIQQVALPIRANDATRSMLQSIAHGMMAWIKRTCTTTLWAAAFSSSVSMPRRI